MSALWPIGVSAQVTAAGRTCLTLLASVLVLLHVTAARAQPASEFALRVPLTLERNEGLHVLELPEAIYRASLSADLLDLRIFNARGEALALAPLPAPPAPAAKLEEAPALSIVPLPSPPLARDRVLTDFALRVQKNGVRAVIELSPATVEPNQSAGPAIGGYLIDLRGPYEQLKGRQIHGVLTLAFAPDSPDFANRIEMLASDNLVDWEPLAAGALVRSRQFTELIQRNTFELARVAPFVRVTWRGDAFPQLEAVRFAVRTAVVQPELPRAVLALVRGDAAAGSAETYYVDLPVSLPVTRIHLRVPHDNQVARARVWSQNEIGAQPRAHLNLRPRRAPERWLAEGGALTLFRVDRAGQWIENEPLALSRSSTRLRIDIVEPPLGEPPSAAAEWRPGRIAFVAGGPAPFTLAIGRADSQGGPVLDVARLLPAEDSAGTTLPVARLTGESVSDSASTTPLGRSDRSALEAGGARYLLWGVLAIAVALLAAMAWRIWLQLTRSKSSPPSDAPTKTPRG